jgi:hypothetical protein
VWIDVRDAGSDNIFNAVGDRWFDSAGTSDFTSSTQIHSTYTVTGGSPLPFTLSIPVNTYASSAGRKYRVTSRAFDNSLNSAGTKVGTQESPADITSDNSETNGNVDFFVIDTSAPVTSINSPAHGASPTAVTLISGTSVDPEGFTNQGTSVTVINIAYYENSGNGGADRFWNFATRTYSILQDPNAGTLPDTVFSTVTSPSNLGGTPNIFQWTATGASTPTFTNDRTYQIFVRTRDIPGNVSSNPASAAANTSRVQFTKAAPTPQSGITTPSTTNAHFKPTSLTSLAGTTQDSTTAQFRLTHAGADNIFDSGNDDQAWNGSGWVSTTTFTGYLGVANFDGSGNWSAPFVAANWVNAKYYKLQSLGKDTNNVIDETQFTGPETKFFVIDSTNPVGDVTEPDQTFEKTLAALSGTASDNVDAFNGAQKSIYFRLKKNSSSTYWVNVSSSYVADPSVDCITVVDNTCLPATSLGGNAYNVTHSSFTSGQAFQSASAYTATIVIKDAAGNSLTVDRVFTWDTVAPDSGITRPTVSQPVNSLSTLSGTASDDFAVYTTSVSIQSLANNKCFNPGTNFFTGTCPFWIATSSDVSANWSYTDANINNRLSETNTWYVVLSRAIDVARNNQTGFTATVSSRTFLADTQAPNLIITYPPHNATLKPTQMGGGGFPFAGTASDPNSPWNSGIRAIQIRLSYLLSNDTWYWSSSQTLFSSGSAVSNSGWFTTSDTAWNYFGSITWGGTDRQYRLEARGEDDSYLSTGSATGNISVPVTVGTDIVDFIIDGTAPSLAVTQPAASAMLPSLSLISGTVNATLSGTNRVEIKISTGVGAPYYWTSSSWTTTQSWIVTDLSGQTTWSYTVPPEMISDATYTVVARAYDNALNVSTTYSTRTFTVDITTPTATITFPVQSVIYSQIQVSTPITGTAADAGSFSTQLSTVQVSIYDVTDNDYFTGAGYGAGPVYLGMNGGTLASWSFTHPNLSFENDDQYQITARVIDTAGNVGASSVRTFAFDIEAPTSTVTSPAPGYISSLTSITGTATDERFGARTFESKLGTYTVGVAIFDSTTSKWWDGDSFDGASALYDYQVVTTTTVAINTWIYSTPGALLAALVDGHGYRLVSRAYDLAGNAEFGPTASPAGVGISVIYDNVPPTTTVMVPSDATPTDDTSPRLSTVTVYSGTGKSTIIGRTADGIGHPCILKYVADVFLYDKLLNSGFTRILYVQLVFDNVVWVCDCSIGVRNILRNVSCSF